MRVLNTILSISFLLYVLSMIYPNALASKAVTVMMVLISPLLVTIERSANTAQLNAQLLFVVVHILLWLKASSYILKK